MLAILATTFPFFALVLCGYLAVRRQMLPQLAIPGMNGFVLYFALPCLLYRFGAQTPLAQLLDPGVFGVYLLCALIMVGLAVAATLSAPCWRARRCMPRHRPRWPTSPRWRWQNCCSIRC